MLLIKKKKNLTIMCKVFSFAIFHSRIRTLLILKSCLLLFLLLELPLLQEIFSCCLNLYFPPFFFLCSCYANAVLQCLAFTPPLNAYFLQGIHSRACMFMITVSFVDLLNVGYLYNIHGDSCTR